MLLRQLRDLPRQRSATCYYDFSETGEKRSRLFTGMWQLIALKIDTVMSSRPLDSSAQTSVEGVASRSRTKRIALFSAISKPVEWGLGPLCFALCLAVCGPGAVNCPTQKSPYCACRKRCAGPEMPAAAPPPKGGRRVAGHGAPSCSKCMGIVHEYSAWAQCMSTVHGYSA